MGTEFNFVMGRNISLETAQMVFTDDDSPLVETLNTIHQEIVIGATDNKKSIVYIAGPLQCEVT